MKLPFNSIKAKLTAWYAIVVTAIILVFSAGVYIVVRTNILDVLKVGLRQDADSVQILLAESPHELAELEERASVRYFHVRSGGETFYVSRGWEQAQLDLVFEGWGSGPFRLWEAPDGDDYYVYTREISGQGAEYTVAVAENAAVAIRSLRILLAILLLAFPVGVAAAVITGYFLAGRMLAPFGKMATKAQEISAENLSERLPVHDPNDEFGQLATVFNRTLERLDRAFAHLRRFTADASHELRTPLTALRSVGEVGLQKEDADAEYYRDVIGSMLEEADRLALLVDNLLILTRGDAGQIPPNIAEVSLLKLIRESAEHLQVLAEEKGQKVSISADEDVVVLADHVKLKQALVNLMDNAIKYTPPEGEISVILSRGRKGKARIEISDTGPGIAPEHHQRVFDRFYRVDANRRDGIGGAGLGLAIAQWAVELNGGTIDLESVPGEGCTFTITLPYTTAQDRSALKGCVASPSAQDLHEKQNGL